MYIPTGPSIRKTFSWKMILILSWIAIKSQLNISVGYLSLDVQQQPANGNRTQKSIKSKIFFKPQRQWEGNQRKPNEWFTFDFNLRWLGIGVFLESNNFVELIRSSPPPECNKLNGIWSGKWWINRMGQKTISLAYNLGINFWKKSDWSPVSPRHILLPPISLWIKQIIPISWPFRKIYSV